MAGKLKPDASQGDPAPAPAQPEPSLAVVPRMGAATHGDDLPNVGRRAERGAPRPRVIPSPPFWLVFAPDRWGVVSGRVVPLLYRLPLAHGANGVDGGPDRAPDPSGAFQMIENKGHTVIDWRIDGRPYLRSYVVGEGVDPKTRSKIELKSWHTRWETLYDGSDRIESDTQGYADWLAGLIAKGLLPRPRPYILADLESQYATRLAHAIKKWGEESNQTRDLRRDLAAVRAEMELVAGRGRPAVASDDLPPEPARA